MEFDLRDWMDNIQGRIFITSKRCDTEGQRSQSYLLLPWHVFQSMKCTKTKQ